MSKVTKKPRTKPKATREELKRQKIDQFNATMSAAVAAKIVQRYTATKIWCALCNKKDPIQTRFEYELH
jgi:hypothetical protein